MQIKRIGIITVSLVFAFTSIAFSGETQRSMVDHSDLYSATPDWGKSNIKIDRGESNPEKGVKGYYGPEGKTSSKSGRPLGFPLDRHPQLDVWVPPAGHPPYGPGA
jgi:hypothetical protein